MPDAYVVAGSRPWCRKAFEVELRPSAGEWHFVERADELTTTTVAALQPRYLFFLHWSWRVPDEIVSRYECVCFHMADVPYGRGGSPLQNLIAAGHRTTKLSALRMVREFDAGPVYLKADLSLEGNAEEIYIRAARLGARMARRIIEEHPQPVPQSGEPVVFRRRTPTESEIPDCGTLAALHDFVRMLDADGYPRAFFVRRGFRYEFSRAALKHGCIVADVTIRPVGEPEK